MESLSEQARDAILRQLLDELRACREDRLKDRAAIEALHDEIRELKRSQSLAGGPAVPVDEAAKILGCGRSRVYELLASGSLVALPKVGRTRMITRTSVEALLTRFGAQKPRARQRKRVKQDEVPARPRASAYATPEELQAAILKLPV